MSDSGANWPGDTVARAPAEGAASASGDGDAMARAGLAWASTCSGGGSGAAGINGEHTTVAPNGVMRERYGKLLLDRFSVSL